MFLGLDYKNVHVVTVVRRTAIMEYGIIMDSNNNNNVIVLVAMVFRTTTANNYIQTMV